MSGIHKILIVDDDKNIHKLIKHALERTGRYHFLHAYDGQGAIVAYETHNPSVMLLDIDMPIMNGLEVLKSLDSEKRTKCPVIVMSGLASTKTQDQCIEMGAWMFMGKPFQIMTLITSINHLLGPDSLQ